MVGWYLDVQNRNILETIANEVSVAWSKYYLKDASTAEVYLSFYGFGLDDAKLSDMKDVQNTLNLQNFLIKLSGEIYNHIFDKNLDEVYDNGDSAELCKHVYSCKQRSICSNSWKLSLGVQPIYYRESLL